MIIREHFTKRSDGVDLIRAYSDQGMKLRKVGTDEAYDEAVDVEWAGYRYEETDIPVDTDEDPNEEEV